VCWREQESYEEMFVTYPMAKSEFDGIVEQMLMAAHEARSEATWLAEQCSDGGARKGSHLSWGHERTCTRNLDVC